MSVHGQLKVRTSAEQKAAKDREKKAKLEKYETDLSKLFADRQSTADLSALLQQTKDILVEHPDCFTLWNIRREVFAKLPEEQQQEILQKEFQLTQLCLESNPKSYSCWFQRQWILKNLFQRFNEDFYSKELKLCQHYLGQRKNLRSVSSNFFLVFAFRTRRTEFPLLGVSIFPLGRSSLSNDGFGEILPGRTRVSPGENRRKPVELLGLALPNEVFGESIFKSIRRNARKCYEKNGN